MVKKILSKLASLWNLRSEQAFINYLRTTGVKIGEECLFRDLRSARIDISRPSLVTIGSNVDMNKNFQLLTHDWGGAVFIRKYNDFVPAHKRVEIGNNIYFGTNCTVLGGAKIGDNCIIGAYSLVNKEIPPNSVAVGIPAKVICSVDEYYQKRKDQYLEEIKDYARSIQERFGRKPFVEEFHDDYPAFVDGTNFEKFGFSYGVFNEQQFDIWKKSHEAPYKTFEDFLEAAGVK